MKDVFHGIAAQITDQMLDERVDERGPVCIVHRVQPSTESSRVVFATPLLRDSAPDGLAEALFGSPDSCGAGQGKLIRWQGGSASPAVVVSQPPLDQNSQLSVLPGRLLFMTTAAQ
ncbi:hypothetical protein, partial [Streptomyces aureus]|uniref:hypothetical protein n=1 Tax=Streptomyces aureus TaxID=193461 RepID=UPI0031E10056